MFSYEIWETLKDIFLYRAPPVIACAHFLESFYRATAYEYHNNMPIAFKTKFEKTKNDNILINYLYIFNGLNL